MSRDPRIDLQIDHLVLEGVAEADRDRFVSTLRAELEVRAARAELGRHGELARSRELSGTPLEVPHGLAPDELGRRVADHIWTCCREGGE